MKKYVKVLGELLQMQYSELDCGCYESGGLDEEFLCDLCLARLRQQRGKIKRKQRIITSKGLNKH